MAKKLEITASDDVAEAIRQRMLDDVLKHEQSVTVVEERVNEIARDLIKAQAELAAARAKATERREAYESAFNQPPPEPDKPKDK